MCLTTTKTAWASRRHRWATMSRICPSCSTRTCRSTLSTKWISKIKTKFRQISFSKVKLILQLQLNHFSKIKIRMLRRIIYLMIVVILTQCYKWKCNSNLMWYKGRLDSSSSSIRYDIQVIYLETELLDKTKVMIKIRDRTNKIMIKRHSLTLLVWQIQIM